MPLSLKPFLMFQGGAAQKAVAAYQVIFPDAILSDIIHTTEGAFQRATLTVAGQDVMIFDSPVGHAFTFTPATSFFVECKDEEEIRRLSEALLEGGAALMPLGEYGFSRLFVWLNDRFGVSWQLNLS